MAEARWPTIMVRVGPEAPPETTAALAGEFADDGIAGLWERPYSHGAIEVVLYFERDIPPLASARIERFFARHGFAPPTIGFGVQEREDWSANWRKGFAAFPVGRSFEVVPSWEVPSGDGLVLSIDPGLAFGTGTHETTQLVLECLEDRFEAGEARKGATVVDVGTGSAILAIAALKLGFARVLACDIDPDAIHVARKNAAKNGVELPLWIGSATSVRTAAADLILANITAATIVDLLPDLVRSLAPGGSMILSGILDVQETLIRDATGMAGLEVVERRGRGEWIALGVDRSTAGGE